MAISFILVVTVFKNLLRWRNHRAGKRVGQVGGDGSGGEAGGGGGGGGSGEEGIDHHL